MSHNPRWWSLHSHQDRRLFLLTRNKITYRLRSYFIENDFVEVDPSIMQVSPGNETHLHAFQTRMETLSGRSETLYLHTSPEFACKKLLAAGENRIFTFSHTFRNRERSKLHHPEFTMLEWYRVHENYQSVMHDCIEIIRLAAETAGTRFFSYRGRKIDPFRKPQHLSLAEAFSEFAGIDLLSTIASDGFCDRDALKAQLKSRMIRFAEDDTWSDMFSRVLVEKIEPNIGHDRLAILDRYPAAEAALARPCPDNAKEAERFEIFACGVELANAFGELTDPVEQEKRFLHEMDEKQRIYGERYPLDREFLEALHVMPSASGAALGFDRLAMLAAGAEQIDQVIWAPVPDCFHEK